MLDKLLLLGSASANADWDILWCGADDTCDPGNCESLRVLAETDPLAEAQLHAFNQLSTDCATLETTLMTSYDSYTNGACFERQPGIPGVPGQFGFGGIPATPAQYAMAECTDVSPVADPTDEPSASPTAEPVADPTVEPSASPTAEPVASPTPEPTEAFQFDIEMDCVDVETGDQAQMPGMFKADGSDGYVVLEAGENVPSPGEFCPAHGNCQMADMGFEAPEDGFLFEAGAVRPIAVPESFEAPESGLFCPFEASGPLAECRFVEMGIQFTDMGVFVPNDGQLTAEQVLPGNVAPASGLWCSLSGFGSGTGSGDMSGSGSGSGSGNMSGSGSGSGSGDMSGSGSGSGSGNMSGSGYKFDDRDSLKVAVDDWTSDPVSAATTYGDIRYWDVSRVTDMHDLFYAFPRSSFNGDISNWDVSSVTDMGGMFKYATLFNGDLSNWDVSKVTDMALMFDAASSFNGDLSNWDVSSVTNMRSMFDHAESFNGDLSNWDVSSVTDLSLMFLGASSFNGDLSKWDVSSVTNMRSMFDHAESFNGDISNWDVASVTNMGYMFAAASSFNGDLSKWDVSSVTDMGDMFSGAESFNSDLSNWDVSSDTDLSNMFVEAACFQGELWAGHSVDISTAGTKTESECDGTEEKKGNGAAVAIGISLGVVALAGLSIFTIWYTESLCFSKPTFEQDGINSMA